MSPERAELVSQIFVVIFVLLTATSGFLAYHFNSKVGSLKDGKIAEAVARAAEAEEGTARARLDAAEANARSKDFDLKLEKQRELTAKAEERAANAEKHSETALDVSKRAEKGTAEQAPRQITPDEESAILSFLRANPKGKVAISFISQDAETAKYFSKIATVLKTSGWEISTIGVMGLTRSGISISVKDENSEASKSASIIQAAFKSAGIVLPGYLDPNLKESEISLFVGFKP